MTDIIYMKRAFELAQKGRGRTSPNPMVGAVVVKNKGIIAEGFHSKCGGLHAEIIALKKAGLKTKGSTLYVTLEPCFHLGRTPPCVDTIIKRGIKQVVIGRKDPNPLTKGKSIEKLRRAGIKVKVGVMEDELAELNEVFEKYIKCKMPFVVAKTAQTLDGKIATATGESKWITSFGTRRFSRRLRNDFDAILVGSMTVLLDDPNLDAEVKKIKKVILDSSLRISPNARLFKNTSPSTCIMAVTKAASKKRIEEFRKKGVQVIVCPSKNKRISLKWLFRRLADNEISSVLIEGGAHVIGNALKEKLIDKMYIFMAPKILGDQSALSSVADAGVSRIHQAIHLKDIEIQSLGQDLFFQGTVKY